MPRYVILPIDFRPEHDYTYGGLQAFVDCGPYLSRTPDVRWCDFLRLAPGSASVYPLKVQVPGRGEGQFKFEEVQGWRYERSTLEALRELDRVRDVMRFSDASAIPPGIDRDWLDKELRACRELDGRPRLRHRYRA